MKNIIILLAALFIYVAQTSAASFDCKKAHTESEKTICASKDLSAIDDELAGLYKQAIELVSYKEELKHQQREWIKKVRNACKGDGGCLQQEYEDRNNVLKRSIMAARIIRKPGSQINDRDEIIYAAKKMQLEKTSPGKKYNKKERADREFCSVFLEDLKSGNDIEFVEPIVTTDDYNDPKLQQYFTKCPKLTPNKTVYWLPHVWRFLQETKTPKDEWEDSGTKSYSTLDFKLYQVDFDGNKKNGKEFVFSGECYGGHIKILDINQCKETDEIQVNATIKYNTIKSIGDETYIDENTPCDVNQLTGSKNGVLKYKDKFYIYDLTDTKTILYLHKYKKSHYCSFEQAH